MVETKKQKKKAKSSAGDAARRQERRFATLGTFIARPVAILGMVGSLVLGAGVFGLWLLDPPFVYASYLVAAGGLILGVALWFGQPPESAVAIGDAGIAVEDGRDVNRLHWYAIKSLRVVGGRLEAQGGGKIVRFTLGANPGAAAWAIKEAAERIPQVVDIAKAVMDTLPPPEAKAGQLASVDNDQVAGHRCAATNKLITMEDDARLCSRCGQIYEKSGVPAQCVSCQLELSGHTLRA
ncbi:MAG TPA: hypothetical protein VLC09_02305 [Polyangiaceae bacterium]|nr:hypothetical protein [Polyangiaceae bacterium]